MRWRLTVAAMLLIASAPAVAQAWELQQNDPNPFCNDPSDTGPWTEIRIIVDATCHGILEVLSPDQTEVVATLYDGVMMAGYHTVLWDGTEGPGGADLPDGDYPYHYQALDADTGALLFEDTKVATILCEPTPARDVTWGSIKATYRG